MQDSIFIPQHRPNRLSPHGVRHQYRGLDSALRLVYYYNRTSRILLVSYAVSLNIYNHDSACIAGYIPHLSTLCVAQFRGVPPVLQHAPREPERKGLHSWRQLQRANGEQHNSPLGYVWPQHAVRLRCQCCPQVTAITLPRRAHADFRRLYWLSQRNRNGDSHADVLELSAPTFANNSNLKLGEPTMGSGYPGV